MPQALRKYSHQQNHLTSACMSAFQLLYVCSQGLCLSGHQLTARTDLAKSVCCHRDPDVFIRISPSLVFSFDLNRTRVVWVVLFLLIKKDKQILKTKTTRKTKSKPTNQQIKQTSKQKNQKTKQQKQQTKKKNIF